MLFPLTAAALFTLATLLPSALVGLGLWLWRRRTRGYWRGVAWTHAGLFVLHLFIGFPLALGWFGANLIGTRHDELGYLGPRLDGGGRIVFQDRDSLRRDREAADHGGDVEVDQAVAARTFRVPSSDGVTLRMFRLEPRREPPVAAAALVHGLFRSALERPIRLRVPGPRRDRHAAPGGVASGRAPPGRARTPILLYGVSLGTVAVAYALPRLDGVAGVVLDAPIDDLHAAAHRMLSFDRAGDRRRRFHLYEPWRSATLRALGVFCGFRTEDVVPSDVLATLPTDLPMLLIASELDDRAPPAAVEAMFHRLPMHDELRELWITPGAGHGDACRHAPEAYRERLARLLERRRRP